MRKSQSARGQALEAEFEEAHVMAINHCEDPVGMLLYELGWTQQTCRGLLYEIEARECMEQEASDEEQ